MVLCKREALFRNPTEVDWSATSTGLPLQRPLGVRSTRGHIQRFIAVDKSTRSSRPLALTPLPGPSPTDLGRMTGRAWRFISSDEPLRVSSGCFAPLGGVGGGDRSRVLSHGPRWDYEKVLLAYIKPSKMKKYFARKIKKSTFTSTRAPKPKVA